MVQGDLRVELLSVKVDNSGVPARLGAFHSNNPPMEEALENEYCIRCCIRRPDGPAAVNLRKDLRTVINVRSPGMGAVASGDWNGWASTFWVFAY